MVRGKDEYLGSTSCTAADAFASLPTVGYMRTLRLILVHSIQVRLDILASCSAMP